MNKNEAELRIEQLIAKICSEELKESARQAGDHASWTRHRKMPLEDILLCILRKKGLTTTMELRQYFQEVNKVEMTVSNQDYFKQRQKLNPDVFLGLNQSYLRNFYKGEEAECWNGYLLFAIDGSRAEIPDSEENRKVYGESINKYGKAVARANISVIHDVFNRFILDIRINNYRSSEIEQAKEHITALKEIIGDRPVLIMFDRNYSSLEFIDFLEKSGVNYIIRLHKNDFKAEVSGMKQADEEVKLAHTNSRLRHLKQKDPGRAGELKQTKSSSVRIVTVKLANGEFASFVTNLREGTAGDIQRLYRKRWSIEKKYHTLKNKLKFESVTGKASIYVKQDFFAQVIVFNMVQDLITRAEKDAAKKKKKKPLKYEMRINENIAIGLFKEQFIRLMIEKDNDLKSRIFGQLIADMKRNIVPIRKLKSSPRKWKYFNKYKCNQKPSF